MTTAQGVTTNGIRNSGYYSSSYPRTLEKIKKTTSEGGEYWLARELGPELGYQVYGAFEPVLRRAATAMKRNGVDPSQHISETKKEVKSKNNATVESRDYFLSRGACYLIAMNGESSKPEIAAAQAYFAIQTRRMEEHDAKTGAESEDSKRLRVRGKVSASFKRVSGVADQAGVARQGIFHEQRYKGLYGMGRAAVYEKKGLKASEEILDRIGVLELSAHEFQMNCNGCQYPTSRRGLKC
jgi:DNA-damage-inducible protein D